ncbi:MAG: hydrolase [Planctomycetota bacterium]|nr:hydrolase [Planctomycetota bacterium]
MDEIPPASPLLLNRDDSALLIVDVQEKLLPAISNHRIVWNIRRLIDAARIFGVSTAVTEQYPQGLGRTMPELLERLPGVPIYEKVAFSCAQCPGLLESLSAAGVHKLLIVGIEAHVCVLQTVLDTICEGYQVHVCVDAVGSRSATDSDIALRRMEASGAYLTTTESTIFEWCRQAGTPEFKAISALVKESPPS